MKPFHAVVCMLVLAWTVCLAPAAVLRVTDDGTGYRSLRSAMDDARDGDTIEIYSGYYRAGIGASFVDRNNLTIRGVGPTRPVLDSRFSALKEKGCLIIVGNNITIENLEILNTRVQQASGGNGAAIRIEPSNQGLTIRDCYFHNNDNGILGGYNLSSDILVENCEFARNGSGTGYTHNMYIGRARSFTLRHSYTHSASAGHLIKTRAMTNYILYNRITTEEGTASYEVNIPDAGTAYVIGNVIQQSPTSHNGGIIDYASESFINPGRNLYVINNTIVNERHAGTFVQTRGLTIALLQNNIFAGPGVISNNAATLVTNWETDDALLRDLGSFNYRLTPEAFGAIDAGTDLGAAVGVDGFPLAPEWQYIHPMNRQQRPVNGQIDIGAYEYAPNQAPTVTVQDHISVYEGQVARMRVSALDVDGDPLVYTWTQILGPSVSLTGETTPEASFVAPLLAPGEQVTLAFQVSVWDGHNGDVIKDINVQIRMAGDLDGDNHVNAADLLIMTSAWYTLASDLRYDPRADINDDGVVNGIDLLLLAKNWNRSL